MKRVLSLISGVLVMVTLVSCADQHAISKQTEKTAYATEASSKLSEIGEAKRMIINDLDVVVGAMSHIFIGVYLRNEPVEDVTSFTQDIFAVETMIKSPIIWTKDEIPVNRSVLKPSYVTPTIGERYLVFLVEMNLAVYPVPLMKSEAILPLTADNKLDLSKTSEFMLTVFPFLKENVIAQDPVKAIRNSPNISKTAKHYIGPIADSSSDMTARYNLSDLVIQASLLKFDKGDETVYACSIGNEVKILKNSTSAILPRYIMLPILPVPDEQYIVFLDLVDAQNSVWQLTTREGSVIPQSDRTSWDAAMALVK